MTVSEFYKQAGVRSKLRVYHGGNGKILCYGYVPEKHEGKIGGKEILSLWADMEVTESGFGHYAYPYLCVYVGQEEPKDETD